VTLGQVSIRILRFPLSISLIWGMDKGPVRGRSSAETQSHRIAEKKHQVFYRSACDIEQWKLPCSQVSRSAEMIFMPCNYNEKRQFAQKWSAEKCYKCVDIWINELSGVDCSRSLHYFGACSIENYKNTKKSSRAHATLGVSSHIRTLIMGTEMVPETSVSSCNQLTRLCPRRCYRI
jgi:hypothetical protein